MSGGLGTTGAPAQADYGAIEQVLTQGLSAVFGQPMPIVHMHRKLMGARSTHPIERLRVTVASGEELPIIFKAFIPTPYHKGDRREVLIYRGLLAGRRFGAPELYASVYDESTQRYWLFLEDVGESTLDDAGWSAWMATFRRLGEIHGTYADRGAELRALGCLPDREAPYYYAIAERLRHHLRLAGSEWALPCLDRLMNRYDAVVDYLVRQPRTLVHGDVFPNNFALQGDRCIRPLDWESAGLGVGALDVVMLLTGWGPDKPKLLAAYREEFARHIGASADPAAGTLRVRSRPVGGPARPGSVRVDQDLGEPAPERTLACCDIIKVLWFGGWSLEPCANQPFVKDVLERLAAAWKHLDEVEGHA